MLKIHSYFRLLLPVLFVACLFGCNNADQYKSRIYFNIHHAKGFKVLLETVPYFNEGRGLVDSAVVKSGDDIIELKIKNPEERAYKIRIPQMSFQILVINDKPLVTIEADILHPDAFKVNNSPATQTVKIFLNEQLQRMIEAGRVDSLIKDLKSKKTSTVITDSLTRLNAKQMSDYMERYINFADTVSSPGAFLYIYNNVDFGKDYAALRKFIDRSVQRFPNHQRVLQLQKETIDFLKVFEEEYSIGQELPALQLPDTSNYNYTTALSRGKYVFIDFWSTFCLSCLQYDAVKKKAQKIFPPEKLAIISIALDEEKDAWKSYIRQNQLRWTQLIDEKMWKGEVIQKWRIDSIPFNFLLAPDGKIIRKAIPADSVISVLSGYMK